MEHARELARQLRKSLRTLLEMAMMRSCGLYLAIGALGLISSAAESSDAALESRVAELERTVRSLEARVAALETAPTQASRNEPTASIASVRAGNSGDIRRWRRLQAGMSEADVEWLLGDPSKVYVEPSVLVWYYNYPGAGSVSFNAVTHRVEDWSEP